MSIKFSKTLNLTAFEYNEKDRRTEKGATKPSTEKSTNYECRSNEDYVDRSRGCWNDDGSSRHRQPKYTHHGLRFLSKKCARTHSLQRGSDLVHAIIQSSLLFIIIIIITTLVPLRYTPELGPHADMLSNSARERPQATTPTQV